jgi:uncharacterized protein YfaS (alpha-2-macroglobulin family)
MQELFVGDVVTLECEFRNSSGSLFGPDAVSIKVVRPGGTTDTLTSPSNPSTGLYSKAYTTLEVGEHTVYFAGTGANAKTAKTTFRVLEDAP